MQPGNTYATDAAIAILLLGEPGGGKTNLCMEWPDPWFLDADHNMKNAIERHPGKTFYWDNPEVDDAGKPLPEHEVWPRCLALLQRAAADERVKTLVADGMSRMSDYLKAYLVHVGSQMEKPLTVGGEKVMSKSLWEPFATLWKRFIFAARSSGKPFILTAHLKVDENELTTVKEQRVNLQGQLASDLAGRFTDAWCCEAQAGPPPRWVVRTASTSRLKLKCSCGLPPELEFDWKRFSEFMAKRKATATASAVPQVEVPSK